MIEMTRFCKRYICCSVVIVILIFMVYYRYFGRFQFDRIVVSSDEFIAVAYVLEENEENHRHSHNEQQLLNLTNFHYNLQPTDDVCDKNAHDLLGLIDLSYVHSLSANNSSFPCSRVACYIVCWP